MAVDAGGRRDGGEPTPAASLGRILVVDDDASARLGLQRLLGSDGYAIATASDGQSALAEARRSPPDLVLTDLDMPRMDGVTLCRELHALDASLPVIVMTAHSDMQSAIESLRAGAEDYLVKPLQYEAVLWHVRRALAHRAAALELRTLQRAHNDRLVASSVRDQAYARVEAQHRAQVDALLENLDEGVAIADHDGRLILVNHVGRAILGVDDDPERAVAAFDALRAETGDILASPLRRALRGEAFIDVEGVSTRANGERRRLVSTGTSVKDAAGEVVLAIVVFRDVTEARRREQEREEYLALVSHDLLNPLSNILLCASVLKQSLESKGLLADAKLAERAERNVKRMTVMLQQLSEATSLESHGIALELVSCDLRELVAAVVDGMGEPRAARITIVSDTGPHLVRADVSRIERVVANLLTNALKYSADDAPVAVEISHTGGAIVLSIADHGIGIPADSLALLFDRYFRGAAGKARASGLGLGLYIARLIVETHGGRIDVSSEVGRGSTFRVTLPSHDAAIAPATQSAHIAEEQEA